MGRDSSVVATRYELDDPASNPGGGEPPIRWEPGLLPGVKKARRGIVHPPPCSYELKERVEFYLYSHSVP